MREAEDRFLQEPQKRGRRETAHYAGARNLDGAWIGGVIIVFLECRPMQRNNSTLVRVACRRCLLAALWTDDPSGFLDTVCTRRRRCEARLVDESYERLDPVSHAKDGQKHSGESAGNDEGVLVAG